VFPVIPFIRCVAARKAASCVAVYDTRCLRKIIGEDFDKIDYEIAPGLTIPFVPTRKIIG
jgi:hypothetical protein